MTAFFDRLAELLATDGELAFHAEAYAATLVAGALCAFLGLYTVLRRIVFTGVALAQLAAAGVGFSFFLAGLLAAGSALAAFVSSYGSFTFSLLFSLLGAIGLQVRPRRHAISADAVVGLVYAAAAAASILFVAHSARGLTELQNILVGDVLYSSNAELFLLVVGAVVVAVLHLIYRRQFLVCSFDPEFARVMGLPERRYQAMLLGSIALAVALALEVAGLMVVFSFLVVPPMGGLALGRRLGAATRIAVALALAGTFIGFLAAIQLDLPLGPTITASLVALWIVAAAAALTTPTRVAVSTAVQVVAIIALGVALYIFPWNLLDENAANAAPHGHAHNIGPASGPTRQEVRAKATTELAASPDRDKRIAAAEVLGEQFRQTESLPPLLAASLDEDRQVRDAALAALDKVLTAYGALEALHAMSRDAEDAIAAWQASSGLVRSGHPRGHERLIELLGRDDFPMFYRSALLELLESASGGRDFGYDPFADAEDNAAAVASWRSWWRGVADGGLVWRPAERRFVPAVPPADGG